jgi:uncharacterized protein (TIGR02594 family)
MSYLQPPVASQFPPWWRPRIRPKFPLPLGVPTGFIDTPRWLKFACQEEAADIHEYRGLDDNNPRILEYISTVPMLARINYKYFDKKTKKRIDTGRRMSTVDETAWCACFVNWCLMKAEMSAPGHSMAKDWLNYGTRLGDNEPKVGAVAVIYRKPDAATANMTGSGFHVGFYIGGPADGPVLLGGNQSDMVRRKQFKGYKVTYQWPASPALARK